MARTKLQQHIHCHMRLAHHSLPALSIVVDTPTKLATGANDMEKLSLRAKKLQV